MFLISSQNTDVASFVSLRRIVDLIYKSFFLQTGTRFGLVWPPLDGGNHRPSDCRRHNLPLHSFRSQFDVLARIFTVYRKFRLYCWCQWLEIHHTHSTRNRQHCGLVTVQSALQLSSPNAESVRRDNENNKGLSSFCVGNNMDLVDRYIMRPSTLSDLFSSTTLAPTAYHVPFPPLSSRL